MTIILRTLKLFEDEQKAEYHRTQGKGPYQISYQTARLLYEALKKLSGAAEFSMYMAASGLDPALNLQLDRLRAVLEVGAGTKSDLSDDQWAQIKIEGSENRSCGLDGCLWLR